ncbi:MAG: hypothetical protein JO362_08090 [Streptomycetaceae bacterium]|nr:hypothetical protein [Streptomycetaceae bacterium]
MTATSSPRPGSSRATAVGAFGSAVMIDVSAVADAVICGVGVHGYMLALIHLTRLLEGEQ